MSPERPTMLKVLADMAKMLAQRSTCARAQNGALIHDSRGVILSGGYNGALAGMPHCDHACNCAAGVSSSCEWHSLDCRFDKPCETAMHAEANAIVWAARRGVAIEGQYLTCTMSPCYRCAQLIIQAGIKSVKFLKPYRDGSGIQLMLDAGLRVSPML